MKAVRRLWPLMALAACAGPAPSWSGDTLTGQWGGEHIGLVLTAESGRLDYDCASGTIDEPLRPDAQGRFAASGRHVPGQGGPERADHVPPSYPARYSGVVNGDRMTLRVDVPAQGTSLGPFALKRGAEPMLLRCL